MDAQRADEVSSSSVSSDSCAAVTKERREEALTAIRLALNSRGTVLTETKLLWLAADFETDIFEKSAGYPDSYELFLSEKVEEIKGPVLGRADAHSPTQVPDDASRNPSPFWDSLPFSHGAHNVFQEDEPKLQLEVPTSPDSVLPGSPKADPGHGISDNVWARVQAMRVLYFVPLQACYVAIVAALREEGELPAKERKSLVSFKRLVLGLVVFLSAEKGRVPARFDQAKLERLEREVVQILGAMLKKAIGGVLQFTPPILRVIAGALKAACQAREVKGSALSSWDAMEDGQQQGGAGCFLKDLRLTSSKQEPVLGKRVEWPRGESNLDGDSVEDPGSIAATKDRSGRHAVNPKRPRCSVEQGPWAGVAGVAVSPTTAFRAGGGFVSRGNGLAWAPCFYARGVKAEPVENAEADLYLRL